MLTLRRVEYFMNCLQPREPCRKLGCAEVAHCELRSSVALRWRWAALHDAGISLKGCFKTPDGSQAARVSELELNGSMNLPGLSTGAHLDSAEQNPDLRSVLVLPAHWKHSTRAVCSSVRY